MVPWEELKSGPSRSGHRVTLHGGIRSTMIAMIVVVCFGSDILSTSKVNIRTGTWHTHGDFIVLPHWKIGLWHHESIFPSITLSGQYLPYPTDAEHQAR